MTDDEFLKFAHEADQSAHNRRHVYAFTYPQLKRAFEAVAAAECEACALRFEAEAATWEQLLHLRAPVKRRGTAAIRARATTPTPKETS